MFTKCVIGEAVHMNPCVVQELNGLRAALSEKTVKSKLPAPTFAVLSITRFQSSRTKSFSSQFVLFSNLVTHLQSSLERIDEELKKVGSESGLLRCEN